MRRGQFVALVGLALVGGCTQGEWPGGAGQQASVPTPATDGPLFVHFPELDHRIVRLDRKTGAVKQTIYPDRLSSEAGHLLDFAISRRGLLVALIGNRRGVDDPRLFIVDLKSGKLKRALAVAPWPQNLTWTCAGRLLVGHGTPAAGPGGRLSVVDLAQLEVMHVIPLEGAATAVIPVGKKAFAVERTVRELDKKDDKDVLVLSSLAEVDLESGKVLRRRQLPPGARVASLGPSGHLYVAQASGPGTHATDGTVTVIDRRSFNTLHRLRLDMVVRKMVVTPQRLVLNMLSNNGDVWVAVMKPDDSTLFDFRMGELTGADLAVVGQTIHIPMRRDHTLFCADLKGMEHRSKLMVRLDRAGGRIGLVRTFQECR